MREKYVVFILVLMALVLFSLITSWLSKDSDKFWENKTEITALSQTKYPIKVESISFSHRTYFINTYYSSSRPFCSGRDTMCFIDFLKVGDRFHYYPKRNQIEVYRDSLKYVFPRYK